MRRWVIGLGLGLACIVLLMFLPALPARIGQIDWTGYWSASYLLARGENFGDPQRLRQVQRELTGWREDYPMMTWNPPWLLPIVIPYTLVSFQRATWLWLLTNIGLVFASSVIVWQVSATSERVKRLGWLAPLVAFAYSPTLTALIAGQVNLLVFAGIAGVLFFTARRNLGCAGIALALASIKLHLIYLTISMLLLGWLRERAWRAWVGLIGTFVGLIAIVAVLRPTFLFDYLRTTSGGNLLGYQVPTLGSVLAQMSGWLGFKLIALVVLPIGLWLTWRVNSRADWRTWIDLSILVSVITAPFGWSYDFVLLLVPLLRVIVWIIEDRFQRIETWGLAIILSIANLLIYYQRVVTTSEMDFFWIPLLIACVYLYALARIKHTEYA